jgi:hypothetical protein
MYPVDRQSSIDPDMRLSAHLWYFVFLTYNKIEQLKNIEIFEMISTTSPIIANLLNCLQADPIIFLSPLFSE